MFNLFYIITKQCRYELAFLWLLQLTKHRHLFKLVTSLMFKLLLPHLEFHGQHGYFVVVFLVLISLDGISAAAGHCYADNESVRIIFRNINSVVSTVCRVRIPNCRNMENLIKGQTSLHFIYYYIFGKNTHTPSSNYHLIVIVPQTINCVNVTPMTKIPFMKLSKKIFKRKI